MGVVPRVVNRDGIVRCPVRGRDADFERCQSCNRFVAFRTLGSVRIVECLERSSSFRALAFGMPVVGPGPNYP